VLTIEQLRSFADDGFLVVPGLVDPDRVQAANAVIDDLIAADTASGVHSNGRSHWNQTAPALVRPFLDPPVWTVAKQLTGAELGPYVSGVHDVQVAVTPPPYPHRPGAGHLDGFKAGEERPRSFTLLVGVILSDQTGDDMGNLHAWPGSHREAADYARRHGVDAFVSAVMGNEAMPPVDFSAGSVQVHGAAGDVVFAHYLLAHNSGGNTSDVVRRTLYMRLRREGHDDRWRAFFTDPWADFDGVRPVAGP
jgi:hypothetical protein